MRLALYQPDIPQNTGTILRTAACLATPVDIIGPTGFDMSDKALRRSGMDYLEHVQLTRHLDWEAFLSTKQDQRLVLLTAHASIPYADFKFSSTDIIMLGRESAGVPKTVHDAADARLLIPMQPQRRSINIAIAAAMVLGEALRQTGSFPSLENR